MAAVYPGAVRIYGSKTDLVDLVLAEHVNLLQDEVTAVETALGTGILGSAWSGAFTTPSTHTSLTTRLTNIESGLLSKQDAATAVTLTGAQTLTNKSITSPTVTGTVALPGTTSIGTVTSTEIGYIDGVTSSVQTQLDNKAPLASPALTGTPTAPTATAGTNTTQVATTAFATAAGGSASTHAGASSGVHGAVGSVVGTTDSQTLTNKTITSPTMTGTVSGSFSVDGTVSASGSGKFSGLGAITICTSATRPGSPSAGQVIYETDTALFFGYNSSAWSSIGGGGAAYQTSAPTATLVGALWVDSDNTASSLNTNDFLLKSEATITYATIEALAGAGLSPLLLMGA